MAISGIYTSDLTQIHQYRLRIWVSKPFSDVKTSKSSIVDMEARNLTYTYVGPNHVEHTSS